MQRKATIVPQQTAVLGIDRSGEPKAGGRTAMQTTATPGGTTGIVGISPGLHPQIPGVSGATGSQPLVGGTTISPPSVTPVNPSAVAPTVTPGPAPTFSWTPATVRDRVFYGLGFVPLTALKAQTQYGDQLLTAIQQAQQNLQGVNSKVTAAQSLLASLNSQVANLKSKVQAIQSQITSLNSQITSATSSLGAGNATVASLQAQLASLKSGQSAFLNSIASTQASIAAISGSITGLSAVPSGTVTGSQPVSGDAKGGTDPDGNALPAPYDPSFAGFDSVPIDFAPGFIGLTTSSGSTFNATRFASAASGWSGLGSVLAPSFGYVPKSTVSTAITQQSALQAQLGSINGQIVSQQSVLNGLTSQNQGLAQQVQALNGQVGTLNGQLGSLQSVLTSLQQQGTGAGSAIAALQQQIANLQALLPQLSAQWGSLVTLLQTWQSGSQNFPIAVSWNFGDGATATGSGPSHTFTPGSFNPSCTISVTTPDGTVRTHTFQLPGLLVGQWPQAVVVGGYDSGSNSFLVYVTDRNGNVIPNTRVWAKLTVLDVPKGAGIYSTGSNGSIRLGGGSAGRGTYSISIHSLRNPLIRNVAS
jgi:peptidoglycan hydrolase CwlO-like protein